MSELMLDVSQAHELKLAFRRNGWTNADIKALSEGYFLSDVLKIMRGELQIKNYFIDCDADPFIPDGWKVEEHKKGGLFKFDPPKISLYLSKEQKGIISGHNLRKELANKPVMNANVLDCLLAYPEFIPDEWMCEHILFWGTIYRDSDDRLVVRHLLYNGCEQDWSYCWLDSDFNSDYSAAIES